MDWLIYTIVMLLLCYLVYSLTMLLWYRRIEKIHREFSLSYQNLSLPDFILITLQILTESSKLIWWRINRRDKANPELAIEPSDTHILCVHGFHMDGSCFWGMRQFFADIGHTSSTVNLGLPYIAVEKYVSRLERRIEAVVSEYSDKKLVIVAHSMGGLITRLVLQKRPDLIDDISLIVTLGSPHYGTSSLIRYRSKWVDTLFSTKSQFVADMPSFQDLSPDLKAYSVASHHDFIVFPEKLALLSGTEHVILQNLSHVGLLTEHDSHRVIKDCINQTHCH